MCALFTTTLLLVTAAAAAACSSGLPLLGGVGEACSCRKQKQGSNAQCKCIMYNHVNVDDKNYDIYYYYYRTQITDLLSLTVQRICMKFGLAVAHNSGCLNLLLEHWSSFPVGAESILFTTFVSLFKCTVNKEIETLVTPHSKVLCN